MISICTDDRGCITSLCPDDLTGTSGWQKAGKKFNLTMNDDIFDSHGAPLYKLVSGKAVARPEEERMQDWPEEPDEPNETEQLVEAARILLGEAE